ncbi:MAG: uroporphyrinogen decarboxylase family protein [Clostridiales bacterium]|jgi:hypothetical protein|nr:uroporphyrinogen-III decarboxylase [Eubacteriales bacterium]MDH7566721.1 uroporphyrinogen decarboxylase family protein [Clostridiales bacterium]
MPNQELFNTRVNRIMTAATLGKPDQIPVVLTADAFCAKHMGVKLADFIKDYNFGAEIMLKSFLDLGGVDGVQCLVPAAMEINNSWLSRYKLPGRELGDDELWQVNELEVMHPEDYDDVIKKGYNRFCNDIVIQRLGGTGAEMEPMLSAAPAAAQNAIEAGIVPFVGGVSTIPYETFCGGRTMAKFMQDLFKIPDKVQEAMDASMPDIIGDAKGMVAMAKPLSVWVGGWRTASQFLSRKLWERFVWPYFKMLTEAFIDEGVIPTLHLDADWERDLNYLLELPKGKFIFSPDGATDMYKAKEILDGHACFMGDVPPAMLALGTVDGVYNYSRKLISDFGPSGYILSQGCCIPPNAKVENVKAMIAAATGK